MNDILQVVIMFASLGGVGALVAAIVNVLKTLKIVPDGAAGRVAAGLNLLALITLVTLTIVFPDLKIGVIDTQAGIIATVFMTIAGYVVQIFASDQTHLLLANARIPVVGKSFSTEAEDALTGRLVADT